MENINQINKIHSNEQELYQAYMELGKAYYEGKFEEPLPELLPLFDKITKLKSKKKMSAKFCPNCGKNLEEKAAFCTNCGYKVK